MEHPPGKGGLGRHPWDFDAALPGHGVDQRWTDRLLQPRGAYVIGRNMFGPVRGSWSSLPAWQGWWADEPPYPHRPSS